MRRARGSGGRFLNTKKEDIERGCIPGTKFKDAAPHQPTTSLGSEIIKSDSGNLNSVSGGSGMSGSEVTSMFMQKESNRFNNNDHFYSPLFHPVSTMARGEHGISLSNKWVKIADGCADLLKAWSRLEDSEGLMLVAQSDIYPTTTSHNQMPAHCHLVVLRRQFILGSSWGPLSLFNCSWTNQYQDR